MKRSSRTRSVSSKVWPDVGDFDFARIFAANGGGLKAMAELQEHVIARTAAVNREIAAFVDRRLKHNQETVHAFASCTTPQEAMHVWGKFVDTATRDYQDEMSAIARLSIDQAQEAIEDVQRGVEGSTPSPGAATTAA